MKKTYQKPEMKIIPEIWKVFRDNRRYKKDGTIWQGAHWEVSNYANVKRNGEAYECKVKNGYKYFTGSLLHRAVAKLFVPNPENKPCVDHIDTNPLNNCWYNLRWVTPTENANNPLTKIHLSESLKDNPKMSHKGERNPMYGKNSHNKNKICINNGKNNKYINESELDNYLNNCWYIGTRTVIHSNSKNKHRVYDENGKFHYE